jgi:starvation-inducible DNA-binding protein
MKTKTLYKTEISLNADTRAKMIELLNQQLADAFDVYSQTKQAHWNVKGMNFISLHELFDATAAGVLVFVDMIAERITALGGVANGTVRMAAQHSQIKEFADDIHGGEAYVREVAQKVGHFANTSREAIDTATDAGDQATADLFTEIVRDLDKQLYFLESHLN